jgi:hemerythrin superfamily protein
VGCLRFLNGIELAQAYPDTNAALAASHRWLQGEHAMIGRNDEPQYPIDAIALLKTDHRKVKNLFARYESAGNFPTKQLIAEQVFTELELHAQLEEHVFYPAYEAMTGKHGTQLVADSRLAHEHVRELMIELQGIDLDEAEFEVKFHELMGIVREHVAEEENAMFPEAEQMLADQLEDLMDHMVALKQQLTPSPQQ